jgi:CheY-like chemotaxis protein
VTSILLVDDEPVILELLDEVLSREGYQTMTAADGVDALEILDRAVPDLVVADTMMPRLSGIDMVRQMRRQPRLQDVPVIMTTTVYPIEPLREENLSYLPRPLRLDTLLGTIEAAISRSAS